MSTTKTPVELAIERAMARIGCPPGDNSDADLYHELSAALSSLKSMEPRLTLQDFDDCVAEELQRVSHIEYNSHEICKHFASKVRERLTQSAKP